MTTKKKRSSDPAWKRCERETAKWLQRNDGVDPQVAAVATKTGRVGNLTHLQYDCSSEHYKCEVKRTQQHMNREQARTWKQINQIAHKSGEYDPMMVFHCPFDDEDGYITIAGHRHRLPPMHVITPERHQELLEAHKEFGLLFDFMLANNLEDRFNEFREKNNAVA